MAPKKPVSKPVLATPVRQGTRPSYYRTPVSLTPAQLTAAASATASNSLPPASSTPAVSKAKPKAKTPDRSKAASAKPKPQKTPKGKGKSRASPKKAAALIDHTAETGVEGLANEGDSGRDDVESIASDLSPARSTSPPPGWGIQKSTPAKRKHQHEDSDYEDEPAVKQTTKPMIGSKKKKEKKSVTWAPDGIYKPEAESEQEEETPVPSTTSRKRKSKPSEEQEYKDYDYDDDPEDDEMEDLPIDQDELDFINNLSPHTGASQSQFVPKNPSGHTPSKRPRQNSPSYPVTLVAAHTDSENDEDADEEPIKAARELFLRIEQAPGYLDLAEIGALFLVLQEEIAVFCKRYFNFVLTPRQEQAWPLHLLAKEYRGLFNITQYIADNPGCGWRDFLTKRAHRPHLVHGIIGEWFVQRIFKHTAFAVPDALLEELEAVDHEYLRYDAFVRNKRKAAIIERSEAAVRFFPVLENDPHVDGDDSGDIYGYKNRLDLKARELANEFMQVLRPLLPPPAFDPLVPRNRQSVANRQEGIFLENEIYFDIVGLIKKAACLHHCLLFAGGDGLVVQIVPHIQKGTMYTVDDADRNICVNANELNNDKHRPVDSEGKLVVKMTCFGRVQAVMPHGPDLTEMEEAQQAAEAVDETLTREDAEQALFPLLPYELQENNAGRSAVADLPAVPGTEWNAALARSTYKVDVKKHYQPRVRPDLEPEPEPIRHPYVTLYPRIAPSNLYCEWASNPENPDQFPQSQGAYQQSNPQSLAEAVAEAQQQTSAKTDGYDLVTPAVMAFTAGSLALGAYSMYRHRGRNLEAWKNLRHAADSVCSSAYSAVASVSTGASSYLSQLLAPTSTALPVVTKGTIGAIIHSVLDPSHQPTAPALQPVIFSDLDHVTSVVQPASEFTRKSVESSIQPAIESTLDRIESELEYELSSDLTTIGEDVPKSTLSTPSTITPTLTEWTTNTQMDMDPPTSSFPPANTLPPTSSPSPSTRSTNMSALLSNLKSLGHIKSDATALPEAHVIVAQTIEEGSPQFNKIQSHFIERLRNEGKLPPPEEGSAEQQAETTAEPKVVRSKVL